MSRFVSFQLVCVSYASDCCAVVVKLFGSLYFFFVPLSFVLIVWHVSLSLSWCATLLPLLLLLLPPLLSLALNELLLFLFKFYLFLFPFHRTASVVFFFFFYLISPQSDGFLLLDLIKCQCTKYNTHIVYLMTSCNVHTYHTPHLLIIIDI